MPFQYPTRVKKKNDRKLENGPLILFAYGTPCLMATLFIVASLCVDPSSLGATLGIVNCGGVSSSQSVGRTDRALKGSFLLPDWIGDFEWSTR